MNQFALSYIVTTYNKLPYLRRVLQRLVEARQPNEEIIVCDGGSTDGTAAYLQQLHAAGLIQQLVVERDKGEAHGFNKGLLRAQGEILKIITDDDAFHYPSIRAAALFMQQNPSVDVLLGNSGQVKLHNPEFGNIPLEPARQFQQWLAHKTPFWMVALTLMIRRDSLALTGLFSTGVVLVDLEFIYRITSLNVNIAWCTAVMSTHVDNPDGNFNRMGSEAIKAEHDRMRSYYNTPRARSGADVLQDTLEALKRPVRPLKRAIFDRMGWKQIQPIPTIEARKTGFTATEGEDPLDVVYRVCDDFMETYNSGHAPEFLFRPDSIRKVLQE